MPERVRMLRDRLRPYLLGIASLFDLSGTLTLRAARETLPGPGDWTAVRDCFDAAGRDIRDAMPGLPEREDEDRA